MTRQTWAQKRRALQGLCSTSVLILLFFGAGIAQSQVSFQELRAPDTDISYNDIFFVSNSTGIIVGEQVFETNKGAVGVTHDKGKTWSLSKGVTKGRLFSGTFADDQNGWAVGEGGEIVATTDGGKTWRPQTSKVLVDLYDITFLNPRRGWAVGSNSTVITTNDGGKTWQVLQGGQPSGQVGEGEVMYMGVTFFNETTGFAAGAGTKGEILQTTDGGKTWKSVFSIDDGIFDIGFANAMTGWAVGKEGQIYASVDSGKTWKAQSSSSQEDLININAGSATTVWAAGEYGSIVYTNNGGKKWNSVSVPVTIGGKTKPLTAKVTGVASRGNEAWVVTDFGRVIYFVLK